MKLLIKNYFELNTWLVFFVLIAIYSIALTIEFRFVFTDDLYLGLQASKKSLENIQNLISSERKSQWINYPITILIVLIPSLLISFCLNIGTVIKEYKTSFIKLFEIAVKAQMVFAINYLLSIVLKATGVIHFSLTTVNNNYNFQSALIFFDNKVLPYWLIYPIQCINLTEIVHILILSIGVSWLLQIKFLKALTFVALWYGIGLLFWIIFTVFLQTIIYI